jgi:hypothetical protein
VDAIRDLPSLGPGATSLLDVSVPGMLQGDHASAVLMPSTNFIEPDAVE